MSRKHINLEKNAIWIAIAGAVGAFAAQMAEWLFQQDLAQVGVTAAIIAAYTIARTVLLALDDTPGVDLPEWLKRLAGITLVLCVVLAGLTGCQTAVTRHADGSYTITTTMDEEQAAAFAERMLQEAIAGYTLYQNQQTEEAAQRRAEFRADIEYWSGVVADLVKGE